MCSVPANLTVHTAYMCAHKSSLQHAVHINMSVCVCMCVCACVHVCVCVCVCVCMCGHTHDVPRYSM